MKKLSIICILSAIFSLCAPSVAYATETAPSVSAECAALYSADTGEFLYTKNADIRHAMASTTKIMTALIAVERCPLDETVTVDKRAVGVEGSSVYLKEGEKISMLDLLYALLLQSANDAAAAIAYHIAKGIEPFAAMMNERAVALGAIQTHFDNPHGLDSENHYTTARDLAIISAQALENEIIGQIVSSKRHTIITDEGQTTRVLVNHNRLLSMYDGAIGIKTGYTKKTGRCLVSAAERDGVTFICVTLDAPNDWNDHIALLDYGYSRYTKKIALSINELTFDIPVFNGNSQTVRVTNSDEISYLSENDSDEIKLKTDVSGALVAPIKEGEAIGFVYAYIGDRLVGSSPLVATQSIEAKK